MKLSSLLCILLATFTWAVHAQINITCDFSSAANKRTPLYNFWSVCNRPDKWLETTIGQYPEGTNLNCIRMLGGWRHDQNMNPPAESYDCYKWDGTNYIYDWGALKKRTDNVLKSPMKLYQFVLDNAPWAFQRNIQFVPTRDNIHHLTSEQEGTYGNTLPPNDNTNWSAFIKDMISELKNTYGDSVVEAWRFRVGTEGDLYPGHWGGTKQEFYDHFKRTADAVRSVLPNTKVGTHFLDPTFTYNNGTLDYKGNQLSTFSSDFITWCKTNHVKYDYVGITFYPKYTNTNNVNPQTINTNEIAPLKENTAWDSTAEFHIHEFLLWTPQSVRVVSSHAGAYFALLAKLAYEKNIAQIYQWNRNTLQLYYPELLTMQALKTMVGKKRFTNTLSGTPAVNGNDVNALCAMDSKTNQCDILFYNYNVNPAYAAVENVNLSLTVPVATGSSFEYRFAYFDKNQCAFNKFIADYPLAGKWESEGGWVLNGKDKNGDLLSILDSIGQDTFRSKNANYKSYNTLKWGGWTAGKTASSGSAVSSKIDLATTIPSFAFRKYEIRFLPQGMLNASSTEVIVDPITNLGTVTLNWTVSGTAHAQVYVGNSLMACSSFSGTSSPKWIQGGKSYLFKLYAAGACDSASRGVLLDSIEIKGVQPVSIRNPTEKNNLKIFPNPITNNGFIIELPETTSGHGLLQIENMQGQIIYSNPLHGYSKEYIQLDKSFSKGVYLLKYTDEKYMIVKKIILH